MDKRASACSATCSFDPPKKTKQGTGGDGFSLTHGTVGIDRDKKNVHCKRKKCTAIFRLGKKNAKKKTRIIGEPAPKQVQLRDVVRGEDSTAMGKT